MANWIGRFDHKGTPALKISVALPPAGFSEMEAIIDTGFTGFLLLPLRNVSKLLSPHEELKILTLADGTKLLRLQAPGTVVVDGQTIRGIVIIEPDGNEAILGMKFLRGANRSLFVCPARNEVLLIDVELPQ